MTITIQESFQTTLHVTSLQNLSQLKEVKAIPVQAWKGPEGSKRLRLPDFKTVGT
jgi:hypothetical protein